MRLTDPEDWRRITSVVDAVLDLPEAARSSEIERRCAGDEALRAEVEAFLDAKERATDFLETPIGERAPELLADFARDTAPPAAEPRQGEEFGAYRILRKIGEGGMGVVFEAEQKSPRRVVALKLFRSRFAAERLARRFALESQTLGRLQHPGIAQIFEAGVVATNLGPQPFFAMELVRGRSLSAHADAARLDARARLDLVARVCDAVQHAHQRGVIHRDLKPENILVDESGAPKVLDFGVARVTDPELRQTLVTEVGQVMGTLAYMCPEQLSGDPEDVDTRGDVYALGVILYEMLAGRLPHDVRGKSLAEAARAISEHDAPPLGAVDRAYSGDLETIVAKALDRDKQRRYPSASDLGADIRRYLRNEPIVARPPSAVYVMRKLAQRNRALVLGAAACILVLIAGVIVSTRQAARATHEAEKSAAITDFLREMLTSADPAEMKGSDVTVKQVLGETARKLDDGLLAGKPEIEAYVQTTLGESFYGLGDFEAAEHHMRRAAELSIAEFGAGSRVVASHLSDLGMVVKARGNFAAAESLLREALVVNRKATGGSDTSTALILNNLGGVLRVAGDRAAADTMYRQALAIRRAVFGDDHGYVAESMNNLATLRLDQGELASAESLYTAALAIRRHAFGDAHPDVGRLLSNLAGVYEEQGEFDKAETFAREALAIRRRVLGEDHSDVAHALTRLGLVRHDQGDIEESDRLLRDALALRRRVLGEVHPLVASSLANLATICLAKGAYAEAESLSRASAAICAQTLPPRHTSSAYAMRTLGSVLCAQGRHAEAEPLLRDARSITEETCAPGQITRFLVMSALGEAIAGQGSFAEAESLLVSSAEALLASAPTPEYVRRTAVNRVAVLYDAWAKPDSAAAWRARSDAFAPAGL
ncbi:MAG: tetratricopeptide repeat protein [bacterium]